jgi:hypothetical protein
MLRVQPTPWTDAKSRSDVFWDECRSENPALSSPYFHPIFFDTVARHRNNVEVAIVEDDGGMVALFPFQRLRIGPAFSSTWNAKPRRSSNPRHRAFSKSLTKAPQLPSNRGAVRVAPEAISSTSARRSGRRAEGGCGASRTRAGMTIDAGGRRSGAWSEGIFGGEPSSRVQ